jgi:hypothetical protein
MSSLSPRCTHRKKHKRLLPVLGAITWWGGAYGRVYLRCPGCHAWWPEKPPAEFEGLYVGRCVRPEWYDALNTPGSASSTGHHHNELLAAFDLHPHAEVIVKCERHRATMTYTRDGSGHHVSARVPKLRSLMRQRTAPSNP